ncbi:hypothetical protein QUF31_21715 [Dickeya chrysanthemi]|uniref:hypothetical protein n=1 Tax=Dickeya chrysanthemi TaxID=556 RepID=UPI0025A24023|nr:hypothetical protein [Dickeya chrysanthemi]WJM85550.1 hypothetical protein QUF31_21715 [Dickeya chrysanthemi]
MSLEGDHDFSGLRLPGIDLLMELLALVRQRPEISTGALLEHFAEREEQAALQKLAAQVLPGDEHSLKFLKLKFSLGPIPNPIRKSRIRRFFIPDVEMRK